jgi:hypothetical protein
VASGIQTIRIFWRSAAGRNYGLGLRHSHVLSDLPDESKGGFGRVGRWRASGRGVRARGRRRGTRFRTSRPGGRDSSGYFTTFSVRITG